MRTANATLSLVRESASLRSGPHSCPGVRNRVAHPYVGSTTADYHSGHKRSPCASHPGSL